MSSTNDNNKNSGTASGIFKVAPIILVGVAVFIAVCFIFGGTGSFGNGVSSVLLGLFAGGAYAIPLLLVLHAVFFSEDVKKNALLSRIIFSVIAVLIISSIDYSIAGFGSDPVFDPAMFYESRTAGGFIGGIVSFCIASLIGYIGLIILDITVVLAYSIVFFGKKDSTARRGILSALEFLAGGLSKAENKIKKNAEERKEAKAESRRQETERRHAELIDDSFFGTDGNMDEINIDELGIHETRSKGRSESRPVLQKKVHNRSALSKEELAREANKKEENAVSSDSGRKKNVGFDFNISSQGNGNSTDAGNVFFGATDKSFTNKPNYGIDESADSVFTKDFDPFDFATGEKLAAKPSTKATIVPPKMGGNGFVTPLSSVTEKSIAEQKRREEFELRKRQIIESRKPADAVAPAPAPEKPADEMPEPSTVPVEATTVEAAPEERAAQPVFTQRTAPQRVEEDAVTMEFGTSKEIIEDEVSSDNIPETKDEEKSDESESTAEEKNIENAYEEIAARVLKNNPGYAVSANRSTFTTTVIDDGAPSAEVVVEETAAASDTAADFKPYTSPTPDDAPVSSAAESILVTERTLVTPSQDAAQDAFLQREIERYSSVSEDDTEQPDEETVEEAVEEIKQESETVFTFGDETEATDDTDEASGDIEEIFGKPDEEGLSDDNEAPLPPEEQNPDVINQRKMFPFLDEESESLAEEAVDTPAAEEVIAKAPIAETVDEEEEAEEEDTAPPFEVEEVVEEKTSQAALVPVEEKPKKKDYSDFVFPPIELLHAVDESGNENTDEETQDNANKLIETLGDFGVTASIKGVDRGPRITRYEVVPAKGVKVSNIMNLADDIALNLAADGIRMEAPIPGKSAVGVEIPNKKSSIVRLRELIETDDFKNLKSKTSVCMGKDVAGQPIFADVAKMPHALIAGATGMGKSVCINSLMLSILYKARPDEVKFIMIDPKQVEFTMYNGIPHLLVPVVTDVKQAAGTLMWAVEEMERRYGILQEQYVRNIDAYNEKVAGHPEIGEPMSRIVIVIDEFAELIMQAKNPVESLIIRIAQKARAAGIHLIIGTQKPVKEVITGLIKSNIPSKLSCKVASNRDSILIFDAAGAEKLLDKGDMLIAFANSIKPQRVQCAFVADEEVEAVMDYLKQYNDGSNYDESVMEEIKRAADKCSKKGGDDRDDDDGDSSYGEGYLNNKEFLDAVEIAVNTKKISTSLIQRKLSIGYGKAAKFIDVMEDMGIAGEANGSKPREVLLTADEWHEKLARTTYD